MTPRGLTAIARRTRLPPRTVRLRLSALYGALFLISGTGLLAITNALARGWPWPGVSAGVLVPASPQGTDYNGRSHAQFLTAIKYIRAAAAQVTHQQLNQLLAGSAVALGVMTVASIVLGWVVAGRVLRPLREMTATARQISEDNLGVPLRLLVVDNASRVPLPALGDTEVIRLEHRVSTGRLGTRRCGCWTPRMSCSSTPTTGCWTERSSR